MYIQKINTDFEALTDFNKTVDSIIASFNEFVNEYSDDFIDEIDEPLKENFESEDSERYRGYFIEKNFYGEEFTVQYQGDDVVFKSVEEAKEFIDEISDSFNDAKVYASGDKVKAKLPSGHIEEFTVNKDLGSEIEVIEKTNSGKSIKYTINKSQIVYDSKFRVKFMRSAGSRTAEIKRDSRVVEASSEKKTLLVRLETRLKESLVILQIFQL